MDLRTLIRKKGWSLLASMELKSQRGSKWNGKETGKHKKEGGRGRIKASRPGWRTAS